MKWTQRVLLVAGVFAAIGWAAGETITYDGRLTRGGLPANGAFDLTFRLYDGPDPDSSSQIGDVVELDDVEVRQGRFTAELSFGPEADGVDSAWLEIEVARGDRLGGFTRLEPRQRAFAAAAATAATSVPSGAVVFFNLPTCPSGWTEHTAVRGRVVVGLTAGGTLGGWAVATSLSDLESRTHTHTYSVTGPTGAAGGHNHIWSQVQAAGGDIQWQSYASNGAPVLAFAWSNGIGNEGSGIYPLAASPDLTLYTSRVGDHVHEVAIGPTPTAEAAAGLPYVQLLACSKE